MSLICFLIEHIWSLRSLFGDRKRRETGWWVNGKRSVRRGIHLWKTNRRNGVTLNRMSTETLNLAEILCVERIQPGSIGSYSYRAPGCCSEVIQRKTMPGSSMLSTENFSNGALSAAGCFMIEAWERLGFLLSELIQKRLAIYEV